VPPIICQLTCCQFSAKPLDPKLWGRECFTEVDKALHQLQVVFNASHQRLQEICKGGGNGGAGLEMSNPLFGSSQKNQDAGQVALTSFRRGGRNKEHGLLHDVEDILKGSHGVSYVHYQSGHENSLFGFGPSDASFAFQTSAGSRACKTEQQTKDYSKLGMRTNWYIEWLAVLHHIFINGGILVLFDLDGDEAMATSPNCAMEITLLYQLFGGINKPQNIRVVVIDSNDLKNNKGSLDEIVRIKLTGKQSVQHELFTKAYQKCRRVLQDPRATTSLIRWIRDFAAVVGSQEAGYLLKASLRLLDDISFQEYVAEEATKKLEDLDISGNKQITKLPAQISALVQLMKLDCHGCNITGESRVGARVLDQYATHI
jgi:hypothetical protein